MTTIVFDHKNGQIAIDSRTTCSGVISTDSAIKYKKVGDIVYFCAGKVGEYDLFIKEFNVLGDANKNLDVLALRIENKKVYLMTHGGDVFRECELEHNEGIGSGCDFALSALDFGKTAKEAVEYAKTKDIYTGGKVTVFNLDGEEVE